MEKDIAPEKFKPPVGLYKGLWFKFILPVTSKRLKLKNQFKHGLRWEILFKQRKNKDKVSLEGHTLCQGHKDVTFLKPHQALTHSPK
jgi:hypothetical protein